jgi:CRISPR-associated protein Cas5t
MEALHVQIEALSASYSYPFLRSGTQLTLPVPPFSGILGNLSACAGRRVGPEETRIAFEFRSRGRAIDLERTRRLQADSKRSGQLSDNPEQGIAKREFHVGPTLDLYLTDLSFETCLHEPEAAPCLGRSQDLGWIKFVRRIELQPVDEGRVRRTVVKFPNMQVGGLILPPLVDYYLNSRLGYVREAGRYSRYQYIRQDSAMKRAPDLDLYHPSDSDNSAHAVVVHTLVD